MEYVNLRIPLEDYRILKSNMVDYSREYGSLVCDGSGECPEHRKCRQCVNEVFARYEVKAGESNE